MDNKYKTREEWLEAAVILIGSDVVEPLLGCTLTDKIKSSCSFATTGNKLKRKSEDGKFSGFTAGQVFPPSRENDGINYQIMVSPLVDDPQQAVDVLSHEVCHVIDECMNGHKAPFTKIRKTIGLYGRKKDSDEYIPNGASTDTKAGPELEIILQKIVEELGPYPHSRLDTTGRKKQTTRMHKCQCSECGYTVRLSQKWLDVGTPICTFQEHGPMEVAD
jgi:hypothetical protein